MSIIFSLYTKINSKQITNLNERTKNIKLPKNINQNLCDFGAGNNFLEMMKNMDTFVYKKISK